MATECYSQLGFGFQPKLVVDFAGGTLTTDAGLLLVREFDEQLGPQRRRRRPDHRHARRALHHARPRRAASASGCIRSPPGTRTSTMPTGCATIPTFQVVAGDGRTTLGSQPTLSRLENAIEWPAIQRLARTGVDWFCAYAYGPDEHPADLILDLDSTDDPTHGTQQLALFHGWYDQHMYHPLVWFEGRTGLLLRTRLRPGPRSECGVRRRGAAAPAAAAAPALSAHADLPARRCGHGDAGASKRSWKPRASATCWASAPIASSRRAWRPSSRRRRRGTSGRGRPVHIRTSFRHRAKSWPHPRRILVKIDVTAAGPQRPLHGHQSPRPRRRSRRVVRRPRHVGELDQGAQARHPRRSPQLSSLPRERVPAAAAQPRAAAARVLPTRGPRGHALGVGDHRHDPSPPAQSRGARRAGASDGSGFISRRHWPGQPLFTALSSRAGPRARITDAKRDRFFARHDGDGRRCRHAHALADRSATSERPSSRADDIARDHFRPSNESSQRAMAL